MTDIYFLIGASIYFLIGLGAVVRLVERTHWFIAITGGLLWPLMLGVAIAKITEKE